MPNLSPDVLALDFDGVVCDGLLEYFQSAWKAYCQIWKPIDTNPPENLAPQFYRLRPVVETGWEMPILLRALVMEIKEEKILQDWTAIATQIVSENNLKPLEVSAIVDDVRDRWIATNLESWLAEHRFYGGVIDRLQQILKSSTEFVIISTKEGRFIKQLLQKQGLQLSQQQIYGKESKRPKAQVLQELKQHYRDSSSIWFVEDRLKTLQAIKNQPNLENVQLFLADWGYNTAAERQEAENDDRIHLISLAQFNQEFSTWL